VGKGQAGGFSHRFCPPLIEEVYMTNLEEHLDHDKLVVLMITQSETEANIVKSLLEESGIHCALLTQVPHNLYPFTVDGLAAIRIKVLESQLEAAKALLREQESDAANGLIDPGEDEVE
jgi:pyruvate/2-oxoacid:ferredoxin oxidoreductase alpha subunit